MSTPRDLRLGERALHDLLPQHITDDDSDDEVAIVIAATENELRSTFCGLSAIGYFLWHCYAYSKERVDDHHLASIGWFIQNTARTAEHLQQMHTDAVLTEQKRELAVSGRKKS